MISKMAVKMNLGITTRNHTADPEIGFLAKSISKSNRFATVMPTAWELTIRSLKLQALFTFAPKDKGFFSILL